MIEEPDCPFYNIKSKTLSSAKTLREIDAHFDDGLTKWKLRYRPLMMRQRSNMTFLNIAATQLFETAQAGKGDALNILGELIACTSARPCNQILCPACRDKRQKDTGIKARAAFANYAEKDLKFMTLLIRVTEDAVELPGLIKGFRTSLGSKLRNSAGSLGTTGLPFKMLGAFEIDLKNKGTHADASWDSQKLIEGLGYNPAILKSQYLLHLHAIVGPLNKERQARLTGLIEKVFGESLLSHQLDIRSLHWDKTKDENLTNLASYMFKARLQFSDNIFADNKGKKRTRYHTPYKGKVLVDYLKVVDGMQNFKGLKFDFGV